MERSNLGLARPRHTLSILRCDVLDRRLILHGPDLTVNMNPYPTLMEEINGMKNVRRTGPEDVKHPSNISLQGCQKRSSSQRTHFRRCPAFRAISLLHINEFTASSPESGETFLTVRTPRISPFKRLCGFMERTDHQKGTNPVART
jgi:hypothetical protein